MQLTPLLICGISLLILGCVIIYFDVTCHLDDPAYTKKEVSKYCDFDISKTDYRIDTLNNGELILMRGKHKVIDGGNNYVKGNDICYLKMRAFFFWENSVKTEGL